MHVVKIECVGLGTERQQRHGVFRLTGLSSTQGPFLKEPVPAQRDYSQANGMGSRGVYAYYLVDEGPVYEVIKPVSWNRSDHYYAQYYQGNEMRLDIEEVFKCLAKHRLVKMS
jgi:hypothetical protein